MLEYPKMENLFSRGDDKRYDELQLKMPEFDVIDKWYVTEKIHGTNIRVHWDGNVIYTAGRTSSDPKHLNGMVPVLERLFSHTTFARMFGEREVTLFGEGYGAGIQGCGSLYNSAKAFTLFDVFCGGYWLAPDDMKEIARAMEIDYVPELGTMSTKEIIKLVKNGFLSNLAYANTGKDLQAEGVVARAPFGLMTRYGTRLMFKLKTADFRVLSDCLPLGRS